MTSTVNKKSILQAIALVALTFPFHAFALLQEGSAVQPGVVQPGQVPSFQAPANQAPANQAPMNQEPIKQVPANQVPVLQVEENLGFSDEDIQITGRLSREATKLQLSATEEKMRAQYLRNKLDRVKLERDLGIEANGGRSMQVVMPQALPLTTPYLPGATDASNKPASAIEPHEKKASQKKSPASLLEVTGVGRDLVAKIQLNGTVKSYVKGDRINGLVINDINSRFVTLSNGSHIDL